MGRKGIHTGVEQCTDVTMPKYTIWSLNEFFVKFSAEMPLGTLH